MPLHVYMYAKPPDKVVRINDAYFLANTKLEDTEQCRRILRIIDQAEYCSEKTFIGRDKSLGALFTDNLSTGTKTLLNISQHRMWQQCSHSPHGIYRRSSCSTSGSSLGSRYLGLARGTRCCIRWKPFHRSLCYQFLHAGNEV